jgi:hypothetical protein
MSLLFPLQRICVLWGASLKSRCLNSARALMHLRFAISCIYRVFGLKNESVHHLLTPHFICLVCGMINSFLIIS